MSLVVEQKRGKHRNPESAISYCRAEKGTGTWVLGEEQGAISRRRVETQVPRRITGFVRLFCICRITTSYIFKVIGLHEGLSPVLPASQT